eukprot:1159015-Pelagomonas_calceolata.AAC.8
MHWQLEKEFPTKHSKQDITNTRLTALSGTRFSPSRGTVTGKSLDAARKVCVWKTARTGDHAQGSVQAAVAGEHQGFVFAAIARGFMCQFEKQ